MKIHIYYHNDHDGIVAAGVLNTWLMSHILYKKFEQIIFNMIDYNTLLNFDHINFEENDMVYFLDYSFSNKNNLNEFEKLLKRRIVGNEVVWIDHHRTSIGIFEEYDIPGIRKIGLCGAAWTYLHLYFNCCDKDSWIEDFHKSSLIPVFLKYIDDYDCWKKIYPETNDFHYGLVVSDPRDEVIKYLVSTVNPSVSIHDIIEAGINIQEYLAFENKEYHVNMYGFEYTLSEDHGGYRCFCMNRKGNSLMFGDKIKEYDAVIPFYFNGSRWTYSMFTDKDNVDCESVAKSFGGGGHLKAAGWTSDKLLFDGEK